MASSNFQTALQTTNEINITVTGRKSGRPISLPVWFEVEGEKLYLLPAKGSASEWYKNLHKLPVIQLAARGETFTSNASLFTEETQVGRVIEKFRARYGAGQVNSLYSNFDVAVEVLLV
jgi:deazaflavin-dependent oxidoreductase (nitroreductase family)